MRIAQVAPLTEAIPPISGGTERFVYWLTEELVALGNDVTLFATGESRTSARLEATWPRALRLDGSIRDPNALHIVMLELVRQLSRDFDSSASPARLLSFFTFRAAINALHYNAAWQT